MKMKKGKNHIDKVQLTELRRINWRPLNEYTPSKMIGQEKLTRPPGIQEPHSWNNEPCCGNKNGEELYGGCDE